MIQSLPEQLEAAYTWIDVLTTLSSFLTLVFSGYAAWTLLRRKRAWRDSSGKAALDTGFEAAFRRNVDSVSANPFALSVNLLPSQATCIPEIERFYKDRGLRCPNIAEIVRPGIGQPSSDLASVLGELRDKRIYLDSESATEVHLFFAGPVGAALHVGAALDNWKLVKVHHLNRGQYEFWGVL